MLDLPAGSDGLNWIVKQDPARLQLIPGLRPASLAAAAAGNQQALAHLRFTGQAQAAEASTSSYLVHDKDLKAISPFTKEYYRALGKHTLKVEAASSGELAALMWLRAICPRMWLHEDRTLLHAAASAGQLNVLKHFRSGPDPVEWDDEIPTAAVPHLECLKWLLSTDAPGGPCPCGTYILSDIASHHDLPTLQWFWTHGQLGCKCFNKEVLRKAVEKGDLPMVQWLRAQDPPAPWGRGACATAATRGDIGMLGWLRGQNPPCPWDASVTKAAAASPGKLEVLIWLRSQDPPCPWVRDSVTQAAASNDVETVQWLRAQDPPCPWGRDACAAAASHGKLDMLIWLRSQDPPCPWGKSCAKDAAHQPDIKIMRWLLDNEGVTQPDVQSKCSQIAADLGNLAMLEELYKHGIPLTGELYILAAQRNHGHILRFLHSCNIALPASTVRVPTFAWPAFHIRLPYLMLLSDLGADFLTSRQQQEVKEFRRACCLFHGLVRWSRRAVSNPRSNAHLAFDSAARNRSGQRLLVQLSRRPPELISKIADAAKLKHHFDFSELPA